MNDNEGTRNFETAQKSPESPKGNKSKPDAKKIITISIFALAIAVILLFSAVIVAEIVYSIKGDPTDKINENVDFEFESVSVSEIEENYYLNTVNKTYPISSAAKQNAMANVVNVYNYNAELKEESSKYTTKYLFLDSEKISLLPEVIKAFNKMTSDLYAATNCDDENTDILLSYGYFVPKGATLECDYIQELGSSVYIKLSVNGSSMQLSSNQEISKWLNKNCAKYGFINSDLDPEESDENIPSTQFRYVGVAHATYIESNNMSFDQYLNEVKKHSTENMLNIGTNYKVYYVEKGDKITVPSNHSYDVSSDNKGGYIVTVYLSESKE